MDKATRQQYVRRQDWLVNLAVLVVLGAVLIVIGLQTADAAISVETRGEWFRAEIRTWQAVTGALVADIGIVLGLIGYQTYRFARCISVAGGGE